MSNSKFRYRMVDQVELARFSEEPDRPHWLRLGYRAMARCQPNGHLPCRIGKRGRPGELALWLGTVDPETGEIKPKHRNNVAREIDTAVRNGVLAHGSHPGCLIAPMWSHSKLAGSEQPCFFH